MHFMQNFSIIEGRTGGQKIVKCLRCARSKNIYHRCEFHIVKKGEELTPVNGWLVGWRAKDGAAEATQLAHILAQRNSIGIGEWNE